VRRTTTAVLLAAAVLTAACTQGGGRADAPIDPHHPVPDAGCVASSPAPVDLGDLGGALDLDPDVEVRVLDNGLTVSVRENARPGGRASLALVVKAGSRVESPELPGVAHYLEHMLFNGTERFPGNQLIQELERFGSAIGPDVNAYTSYDETVYLLDLPDVRRTTRELGVDILREWADRAILDPAEIDAERGVIQEERRLWTESGQGRVGVELERVLLEGTPYEHANTIGTRASIDAIDRSALADFYRSWYRPENMAIVAVGDFDADAVHDLVEDRFEDLERGALPDVVDTEMQPWEEPRYLSLVEPELPSSFGSVGFTVAAPDPATGDGRRQEVLAELTMGIIATRLQEAIALGELPLSEASASTEFPVAGLLGPSVDFSAPSAELRPSVEAVVAEIEHLCRFGVTDAELSRALAERRRSVEDEYSAVDSKQDAHHAAQLREHYLVGRAVPTPDRWYEVELAILDSIGTDDVDWWLALRLGAAAPSAFLAGTTEEHVPSVDELAQLVASARSLALEGREDDDGTDMALLEPPDAAEPRARTVIEAFERTSYPAVLLEYDNGIRVVVQPTTIAAGKVTLLAASPGGLSLLDDDEVAAAQVVAPGSSSGASSAGSAITRSGVGDLDQVSLSRLLADRSVDVQIHISPELEEVRATAASQDLETLLGLVHLYLTEPRVTESALRTSIEEVRPLAEDPTSVPELALFTQVVAGRLGDEPRYRYYPEPQLLDAITAEQAEAVVRKRLVDGGDFDFALVGDVELDEAEELVARYLGTLPGAEPEQWRDFLSPRPEQPVRSTVRAGAGEQGGVAVVHTAEAEIDAELQVVVPVAQALLETRLREVIREELGATYSPYVDVLVEDVPRGQLYALFLIMGDPAGVDELAETVAAELASLAAGEFTDDELARARATVVATFELWGNETLAETHLLQARDPAWSYEDFTMRSLRARAVDRSMVLSVLSDLLDPSGTVEVKLLPQQ
jgi:zinc protease